jgi:hypothetical protein
LFGQCLVPFLKYSFLHRSLALYAELSNLSPIVYQFRPVRVKLRTRA